MTAAVKGAEDDIIPTTIQCVFSTGTTVVGELEFVIMQFIILSGRKPNQIPNCVEILWLKNSHAIELGIAFDQI